MKYSTSTYLKDIDNYKLYLYKTADEIITIKKVIQIKEPFILKEFDKNITLINNGYYIIELVPVDSYYICRLFLDNNFNIIEEYYTVTKNNKIIDGIPMYEDLLLSFIKVNNNEKIYHEELLKDGENEYLKKAIKKIMKLNLNVDDLVKKIKEKVI